MNKLLTFFSYFSVLAILGVIIGIAFWIASCTSGFSNADSILELLKLSLATSAFVVALYTFFSKDTRLRSNGENILVSLIVLIISNILSILAYALSKTSYFEYESPYIGMLVITAVFLYVGSFLFLFRVFLISYNQIYYLRTNKFVKYFKPVRLILDAVEPYKHYEVKSAQREINRDSFQSLRPHLFDHEIEKLASGGSILLTGPPQKALLEPVLSLMQERLLNGNETINYVCADQHPNRLWKLFKTKYSIPRDKYKDIVFIDAYSPGYSFSDDIQRENSRLLSAEGIKYVCAKSFAGLHTAMTKAWNIIKSEEQKEGRSTRRPMLAVYAHTSALCEFESIEQYRIFWWHVIPSEKSYGVVTVIIEDELSEEVILNCLKQRVDFVLKVEAVSPGSPDVQIIRIK